MGKRERIERQIAAEEARYVPTYQVTIKDPFGVQSSVTNVHAENVGRVFDIWAREGRLNVPPNYGPITVTLQVIGHELAAPQL